MALIYNLKFKDFEVFRFKDFPSILSICGNG